jgi:DNA invertase Pin-like site-specific DNA recombinase
MGRPRKTTTTPGVIGYLRVSTEEQAVSGLGLTAQRAAIETECARRDLELLAVHTDPGLSGKSLSRPGLTAVLADLDVGRGSVLMVAKLDRLSRSVHDATGLLLRAERAGWGLIALDANVDTTTPQGAVMTQVLAVFAELERRLIGERTKAALAVKKAQGITLGRPRTLPTDVVERIQSARGRLQLVGHRPRTERRRRAHRAGWRPLVSRDRPPDRDQRPHGSSVRSVQMRG